MAASSQAHSASWPAYAAACAAFIKRAIIRGIESQKPIEMTESVRCSTICGRRPAPLRHIMHARYIRGFFSNLSFILFSVILSLACPTHSAERPQLDWKSGATPFLGAGRASCIVYTEEVLPAQKGLATLRPTLMRYVGAIERSSDCVQNS